MSITADQAIAAFHATEPVAVTACLNCDAPVTGHFCAACGQSRDDHSRSLLSIFHEFVEHHLLLDTKMLRTAYALLLQPGRLTSAYVEGRRVRYVSPFRLYLFMSFAFFLALYFSGLAVFQVTGRIDLPNLHFGDAGAAAEAKPVADAHDRVMAALADTERLATGVGNAGPRSLDPETLDIGKIEFFRPLHDGALQISDATKAGLDRGAAQESARSRRAGQGLMLALEHPRLLNAVLDEWLPRLLVLQLPFAALLLALLSRRRGLYYVDHLAFSFHGQAFAFLLGTVAIAARRWLPELPLGWLLGGSIILWTLFAYRHFYGSGWFGTVFKVSVIGSIYLVTLGIDLLAATIWGLSEIPT